MYIFFLQTLRNSFSQLHLRLKGKIAPVPSASSEKLKSKIVELVVDASAKTIPAASESGHGLSKTLSNSSCRVKDGEFGDNKDV